MQAPGANRSFADLLAAFTLARKLVVALWKFSSSGVVIEGAMMKTA